jgi:hypothetical protein
MRWQLPERPHLGPRAGLLEREQGQPGHRAIPVVRGDAARPGQQRQEDRVVRRAAVLRS